MTQEDIFRMARDAGFFTEAGYCVTVTLEMAERFAALVAEAEREACIKIVEQEATQYVEPVWAVEIIDDMYARGEK